MLISGYVGLNAKWTYKKWLHLWLQVVFYGLVITLAFAILTKGVVTGTEWLQAITPIIHNEYWYMTCYFGLMVFAPFFTKAIQELKEGQVISLLLGGLFLFSVLPTIFNQEHYGLQQGYSVLWLLMVYLLGASIKRFEWDKYVHAFVCLLGLLISTGLTFVLFALSQIQWLSYLSPTVLLQALFFFFLCLKIKTLPRFLEGLILALSPLTLGVYLSHVHPLVFNRLMPMAADFIGTPPLLSFTLKILGLTGLIFLVGVVFDWIRQLLFGLFKL